MLQMSCLPDPKNAAGSWPTDERDPYVEQLRFLFHDTSLIGSATALRISIATYSLHADIDLMNPERQRCSVRLGPLLRPPMREAPIYHPPSQKQPKKPAKDHQDYDKVLPACHPHRRLHPLSTARHTVSSKEASPMPAR